MRHGLAIIYNVILLVSDFLALIAAFALAYFIRVELDDRPLLEPVSAFGYAAVISVLLLFWLAVYAILGLYNTDKYENRIKEFLLLFIGSFIGILFLISTEYVINRTIFPARLVMVYGFSFAFLLTLLFRTLIRIFWRQLFIRGKADTHVLLVGSSLITKELAHSLSDPRGGYRVVGIVGDKRVTVAHTDPRKRFVSFDEAVQKLKNTRIHSIIQTELYADAARNDAIVTYAQNNHIAYRFVPGNSSIFNGKLDLNLFAGIPTIDVHQTELTGWGRTFKRLFDVIGGVIFLLIAAPFLGLFWCILTFFGVVLAA